MAKDRAPKEILKDKRTTLKKLRDKFEDLPMEEIEALFKQAKSISKGNPKEAGASIEITKVKPMGESTAPRRPSPRGKLAMAKGGGLMEATAKLMAKGMKEGGMVVKEKVVAIDKSPNSGLITTKGFGAGRRT
jgi:hypothetical protein